MRLTRAVRVCYSRWASMGIRARWMRPRVISSAGRARRSHRRGHWFKSSITHHLRWKAWPRVVLGAIPPAASLRPFLHDRRLLLAALQLAPATGAVVGDDSPKKVRKRVLVHGFALANLNCPSGQVALSLVDDTLRIGRDGVVDKHIDMIFGRQQRADVAIQ